jgi:hypothetical protein
MDFGKIVDKAKDFAGKNPEKTDGYVDQGTDYAKQQFGHEGAVDGAGQKAKDYLHGPGEGQGQPQDEQPPPPPQQ